jgi:hypothetical protein
LPEIAGDHRSPYASAGLQSEWAIPLFNAFLPQYLKNGESSSGQAVSNYETYLLHYLRRRVPGSIIACFTVDISSVGRKDTMAIATLLSGIFLYLFTISADANHQLAFSLIEAFF